MVYGPGGTPSGKAPAGMLPDLIAAGGRRPLINRTLSTCYTDASESGSSLCVLGRVSVAMVKHHAESSLGKKGFI